METIRQISFDLGESEFNKFMNYVKRSLKSAQNLQSKEIETDSGIYGLTDEHKKTLDERRAKHLSGESKSYTLEEVKAHARASRLSKE